MVHVVAEQGVGSVTVARVVARAGVSRRTFYDLFSGCEDCFLAVFEDAVTRASTIAGEAAAVAPPPWREQVRAGLGALLASFDERPAIGSLLIVDALSAGPTVLKRRTRMLRMLAAIVDRGRVQATRGRGKSSFLSPPPLTAEGIVGAVLGVIHARMLESDRRSMLELLNPLMGMIVLPYLGQAAAAKELARPIPKQPKARADFTVGAANTPPSAHTSDPLNGLNMRLTYRTLMVLRAIAANPGSSNRQVGDAAGVHDQGQISKLLARLTKLGLIHNTGQGQPNGEPNAWTLTPRGHEVAQAIETETNVVHG